MNDYVFGFAESRIAIEVYLNGRTNQIIEHICKLVLMPNHSARNHWKKEIASQLHIIDKLKNTKKYPTQKQLYSWTYVKKKDLLQDNSWMSKMYNHVIKEYHRNPDISLEDFAYASDQICNEYFTWLSDVLSKDGFVDYGDIYDMLDSLLDQYC